ncbi:MAG: glycosyltransferase family 2 protein [Paramuribaculum sp.]|nr:glycosyltransferase family 2 protein [Paramuribaculum sp.]
MTSPIHKNSSANPPVAVIILNWNGKDLIKRFLPSVIEHTPASIGRVIVADNGSSDGSVEMLRTEFPQVEVIEFSDNHGFAQGYNLAIKETGYRYTVLLNSDVEVRADWLTPLYEYMQSHPKVAAVQPKIMSLQQEGYFEYAGACGGFIDRHGYPYCRGRIFTTIERDNGQYNDPISIFWASGAAFMVRTDVYEQAGGLDPQFFAHMEEIDLCWRIQLLGYSLAVVPQASVYHLGGGSLPASNPRKTYLNFRNSLLMLHKNLPDSSRNSTLLKRRLLDTIAWIKFMLTGNWGNANAILRAHRDFRHMRRTYTTHPTTDLLHTTHTRPNILTQYYLWRHNTYSAISH